MIKKGRQAATTLDGIRDDHKQRYQLAIDVANKMGICRILDVGCGTGYGSYMMTKAGHIVTAFDIDQGAIDYGNEHYSHVNLQRVCCDLADINDSADVITMFEVIEHTHDAPPFIARMTANARVLVGSVPNQDVVPFGPNVHSQHVRHYTPDELVDEIESAGWTIQKLGCQVGKRGEKAEITFDHTDGRTLVFVARA